jgi:hypothetical protein
VNVKQKGNRFEVAVARMLRPLWPNVQTSRLMNKWLDGQGVDLVETYPFHIQCKHVERGLDPHKVLEHMPSTPGMYNVLIWKRNRKTTLVVMSVEDATEIAHMLKQNGVL